MNTNPTNTTPPESTPRPADSAPTVEALMKHIVEMGEANIKQGIALVQQLRRIERLEHWKEIAGGALFDTIQQQADHHQGISDAFDEIAKLAEREGSPETAAAVRVFAEAFERLGTKVMLAQLSATGKATAPQEAQLSEIWASTVK